MRRMIYIIIGSIVLFVMIQIVYIKINGAPRHSPTVSREPVLLGTGKPLTYVVLGDSTAVAEGGDYDQGIAMTTAQHLAQTNQVQMINFAVSGARIADVTTRQLPLALHYKPDIVLIAVGANDATHFTSVHSVRTLLRQTLDELVVANCNIKIILTGSADMGAVPRLPQPTRALVGRRARTLNTAVFAPITQEYQVTFVPVAELTGPVFRADHSLFAPDNFHPNNRGYAVWNQVLIAGIDQALADQPSHCKNTPD